MPIDLDQYRRLKRQADDAKAEVDRAEGALSQLMKKLKEDFDCDTLDAAKSLLKQKTAERDEVEQKYNQELASFQKKWGDKI